MNANHSQYLDLALNNKPPEVQAKVREMAQKMNISPDDELFIFIAIICDIERLLETSPQEFEQAITLFQKELNQWSDLNLVTLSKMTHKSEILVQLAHSSEQLTSILSELSGTCSKLIAQLQDSNQQYNSSLNQLQRQQMNLSNSLHQMQLAIKNNTHQVKSSQKALSLLYQKITAKTEEKTVKPISIYKIAGVAFLISTFSSVWLFCGLIFVLPRMMPSENASNGMTESITESR